MPTLESLGLGSGVLTTELVDKLIKAERQSVELRLDSRQKVVETKITAYGEVKSKMAALQATALSLSSPTLTGATKVTSSDESILTAEGSTSAVVGSYSIEVLNTAKAHSLASGTYASIDDVVGTGKLVFSFGALSYNGAGDVTGQTLNGSKPSKTITIGNADRSLAGIRDAVNKANIGVTANIVNDGTGYRLQFISSETGVENAMRIEAQDSSGAPLVGGLGDLSYNETHHSMLQTSKGEDAQIRSGGLTITRASNSISEVIAGVTLNLKSAQVGKTININVSADTETLTKTLKSFVDGYNALKEFVDENSKYDAKTQQGGIFMGDTTMQKMMDSIRSMISMPIAGISGKYRSLTELGINTNWKNKYLLDFNTSKLASALAESRTSVVGMLSKTGTTTDSQITYMNDSVNTKPGQYAVNITQLATQAKLVGGSVAGLDFSSPVVIDSSNNTFGINVNGQSVAVALTQGSYTSGADLAKQIAMQINSNDTMRQYGHSVAVDFNAAEKRFELTSNLYGSSSQISFTAVGSNTANTLGFNSSGKGTYQAVGLSTLNAEAFSGKGATTLPGRATVSSSTGLNFAADNATFSLSLDGGAPVSVVVNQNAQGVDLNSDGHYDRKDTLQAIQNAIDATTLSGAVTASFDNNGYLTFATTAVGASKSLEITSVGAGSNDLKLGLRDDQGVVANGKNPGLTFGSNVEFNLQVDGTTTATKVSLPAGTYNSGTDLATALQNAINTHLASDANFTTAVKGASTAKGDRDISSVDFSVKRAGFTVNVNGVEKEIVATVGGSAVSSVQSALDAAYGAGVVTASLDGTGLKLTTVTTGHESYIEMKGDGRGAYSSAFGSLATGIDFRGGNNATFDLTVSGVTLNVNVNGDGSAGSNDAVSNLAVIQQAVDTALANSGQFEAGDVLAKVDDTGHLYFETQSKNGVRTAATFGADAAIAVGNLNANASSLLGMSNDSQTNGYDNLGMHLNQRTFGYDVTAMVEYKYDATTKLGSLNFNIGGMGTTVRFSDLDAAAISFLGLQEAASYSPQVAKGKNVAGTIDGKEATGDGQYLRGVDGNEKASNGFYLGQVAADFSTPVAINASNNQFKISVDGVEASISLVHGTYNNGADLAVALQKAINENATFVAKNIGVKVEYTDDPSSFADKKFGIISASTGSKSEVKITEANAAVAAVFGFVNGIGDGEKGKDQVGDPSGASGIRLKVTGGALGARGSVTFVSGFGDQLKNALNSFLNGAKSTMATRKDALDTETTNIETERNRLNERLAATEARLRASFMYNDGIIAKMNNTLTYVQQQFEAMAAMGKKR